MIQETKTSQSPVKIIGGGLSGCEAALQLADAGVPVNLYEMRPHRKTPAHKTQNLAELVCSNSFKGLGLTSAHGLFKAELQKMGSKLIPLAMSSRVPAGESLAIDRDAFSSAVEHAIESHPNIHIHREEVTELKPQEYTIVATGPLTSEALCHNLFSKIGEHRLAFFDSIAPVVDKDSIDFNHAFYKNRWEKGDTADFINCPMNKEEYEAFVDALVAADTVEPKPFEKGELFEGCLPIEEMARRGKDTLNHGPLRPVGLMNMDTREKAHAVLQLRAENEHRTLYNLVGCQTRLKWGTQKEIFALVPALKKATFARLGAMHRNTFIDSPKLLHPSLNLKGTNIFFAGQITGAEGYTEAVGTGLYSATMLYAKMHGMDSFAWPKETCLGALSRHLTHPNPQFQPMNLNFGLFSRPEGLHKSQKKEFIVKQCLEACETLSLPWSAS
jgi:methylenetetrahydrofolate--tRNA-(uracil-5-)-methyltransferase